MEPVITKYKKQGIKVNTMISQFDGLPEQAAAEGHAKVANAQKGLAAQHGQRARQEVNSFAQNLNTFTQAMERGMGAHARHKGAQDANDKILTRKKNVMKIRTNDTLTDEQKHEQISKEVEPLSNDFFSVYGAAYDGVVRANTADDVIINAAYAAQTAAEAAGGNAEMFKTGFRGYTDQALDGQRDEASKLTALRAYEKAGLIQYKKLYTDQERAFKIEAKSNSRLAAKQISEEFNNAFLRDDPVDMSESRAQFAGNRRSAVDNGFITQAQYLDQMGDFDNKAEQSKIQTMFTETPDKVSLYLGMKEAYEAGTFDHWKPGVGLKMLKSFETVLKEEGGTRVQEDIDLMKMGRKSSNVFTADYLQFLPVTKQNEYKEAVIGTEALAPLKGIPLAEKVVTLNQELQKPDLDAATVKALNWAVDSVEAQIREAKADPLKRGAEDGWVDMSALAPERLTTAEVSERYLQAQGVAEGYGVPTKFFTKQEADLFTAYLDSPTRKPSEKLKVLKTIAEGTNNKGSSAWNQLSKKGAYIYAGVGAMYQEHQPKVAEDILMGDSYLKSGTAAVVKETVAMGISKNIGDTMQWYSVNDGLTATKSVTALAAKYAVDAGKGEIRSQDMKNAVKDYMGDSGNYNGKFFAPPGVEADDVEEFFEDLKAIPPIPGVADSRLRDVFNGARPFYLGESLYGFSYEGDIIKNADNSLYIIKYAK